MRETGIQKFPNNACFFTICGAVKFNISTLTSDRFPYTSETGVTFIMPCTLTAMEKEAVHEF